MSERNRRMEAAEMSFLILVAGSTIQDQSMSEDVGKNLQINNVIGRISEYGNKLRKNVERMEGNHIRKRILDYGP
jgi:hypothetical protein